MSTLNDIHHFDAYMMVYSTIDVKPSRKPNT